MIAKLPGCLSPDGRLEAISKPQIAFEGKAGADDKAQHTREYVSILKRPSTQPSGAIWGFEMASTERISGPLLSTA